MVSVLLSGLLLVVLPERADGVTVSGTTYTLFSKMRTWNEVEALCITSGFNMLTVKTQKEMESFLEIAKHWQEFLPNVDMWTGLYDRTVNDPNDVLYQWQEDCSLHSNFYPWDSVGPEPDKQDVDMCVRVTINGTYRTRTCNARFRTVCQKRHDGCWFDHHGDKELDLRDLVIYTMNLSSCQETCKEQSYGAEECVALDHVKEKRLCRIFTRASLFNSTETPPTTKNLQSDVYIKICTAGYYNSTVIDDTKILDNKPNVRCPPMSSSDMPFETTATSLASENPADAFTTTTERVTTATERVTTATERVTTATDTVTVATVIMETSINSATTFATGSGSATVTVATNISSVINHSHFISTAYASHTMRATDTTCSTSTNTAINSIPYITTSNIGDTVADTISPTGVTFNILASTYRMDSQSFANSLMSSTDVSEYQLPSSSSDIIKVPVSPILRSKDTATSTLDASIPPPVHHTSASSDKISLFLSSGNNIPSPFMGSSRAAGVHTTSVDSVKSGVTPTASAATEARNATATATVAVSTVIPESKVTAGIATMLDVSTPEAAADFGTSQRTSVSCNARDDGRICFCSSSPTQKSSTVGKLTMDRKQLSSYRRSKTSAIDDRSSAISLGVFGICLLLFEVAILVVLDAERLCMSLQRKFVAGRPPSQVEPS